MTTVLPLAALEDTARALDAGADAADCCSADVADAAAALTLSLYSALDGAEAAWRRFEQHADCTPFQTFDWLDAWQRHVGSRNGVRPVIAVAAFADGGIAFMLPLALQPRRLSRRLCWLGHDVNDYNAPLLARDFSGRVTPERFLAAWNELRARMQRDPALRHDWIELEKMPQSVGGQPNPFFLLPVAANPSGAHFAELGSDWKSYYETRRSSATRRRDRTKRKHLSDYGEIGFSTCHDADDVRGTLDILMEQKRRLFAAKGIPDMFERPGWREFFRSVAGNAGGSCPPLQAGLDDAARPADDTGGRKLEVHVSRVQIGDTCAAANLGVVFGDTYFHMLASYADGELSRYGPGALHLRELLAYAIGRGLRRFDFTIGDEPYKREWSDVHISLGDYAAPATWRGWPAWARSVLHRPLKRVIKQTPWAWRAVSHLRAIIGSLWRRDAPVQPAQPVASMSKSRPPLACVMGDMDLLRPIAAAGVRCAVVARPGVPSLYSRFAQARLRWDDFSQDRERLVDKLIRFGRAQSEPPVLFYEEDAQLLTVSRFREPLAQAFRFVIADAALIEDLVDKARFGELAQRHGLPVPRARRFHPAMADPGELDLRFPVVLKPLTRLSRWNDTLGLHKALAAHDAEALRALWRRLVELDVELIAQELIAGPESRIESYHCYVDRGGSIAAEFTGRKIRTYPPAFGHTTALEITDADDVRRQGRAIVERLGLVGVAKFDFKRDAHGKLHLLEINPRFTLWHNAGAVAGVNIPAMVFADLAGLPRPQPARARAGVRWCRAWTDFAAARAMGMPPAQWLSWTARCETRSSLAWDDPVPPLRSAMHRLVLRRFGAGAKHPPDGYDWTGS